MQVFLSHCSRDESFAARIANDLVLYDLEVWYDEWSIRPGDSVPGAIQEGLSKSDCVLLVVSGPALSSNWVTEELNSTLYAAVTSGKPPIIPLLLESCPLPPMLQHRKHLDFSRPKDYEHALNALVAFLYERQSHGIRPRPTIPGFRQVRLLGEGGFSTVYKATVARTGAVKAIKIPKGSRNLAPEAETAKKLKDHPGIVPVERAFNYKGRIALVMPYAGHSLKWFIEHRKVMPNQVDKILAWMKSLLEVLSFAHSRGVVHCDIKPSNILLDDFGDLRLVDFGIARRIHYAEFQQSTIVRGTLCYLSPEQQLAEPPTVRSDIYSFGAVMYELLTGEKAVGRFRNPRYYNNELPFRVEKIVNRCLEREPDDRYQSAEDVLKALEGPVQAPTWHLGPALLIGKSPAMKGVMRRAKAAAKVPTPVTLYGETGTGKEVVARFVYEEYAREVGDEIPFIVVNVSAVPEILAESELFGHVKGAFTGASSERRGAFALADGGVLLLDEISGAPLGFQARLLRAISEGEIRQVGSNRAHKINVKIIVTTNHSLSSMVASGAFRADLHSRLSLFEIHIPPLRERRSDIPLLVRHFLARSASRWQKGEELRISDDAMEALIAHDWPGNVRELISVIERLTVLGPSSGSQIVERADLKDVIHSARSDGKAPMALKEARQRAEAESIRLALNVCDDDVNRAAGVLGISSRHLRRLLRKHESTLGLLDER